MACKGKMCRSGIVVSLSGQPEDRGFAEHAGVEEVYCPVGRGIQDTVMWTRSHNGQQRCAKTCDGVCCGW